MKKVLIFSLLALAACNKKDENPTPCPAPEPVEQIPVRFSVFDSADGDQFNARLSGTVYYYPASMSEGEVRQRATFSDSAGWVVPLTATWQGVEVPNVGPYCYTGNPAYFTAYLHTGQQVAIVWRFLDAVKKAPMRYKIRYQFLGILKRGQPVFRIETDELRAGL